MGGNFIEAMRFKSRCQSNSIWQSLIIVYFYIIVTWTSVFDKILFWLFLIVEVIVEVIVDVIVRQAVFHDQLEYHLCRSNLRWGGILSKNGCLRAAAKEILSAGSYSNICPIKSNSCMWSSRSVMRYFCKKIKNLRIFNWTIIFF